MITYSFRKFLRHQMILMLMLMLIPSHFHIGMRKASAVMPVLMCLPGFKDQIGSLLSTKGFSEG